jgi:hypothetical protein
MPTPEEQARETIDTLLSQAGWIIQNAKQVNLSAGRGVVIGNFPLEQGHSFADYLFYINGKAAGVIEAKREGATLTGVKIQSTKYSGGFPSTLPVYVRPLPFHSQSTGVERRLSLIEELEATVNANLVRTEWFPRSVLKAAFCGKLTGEMSVWMDNGGLKHPENNTRSGKQFTGANAKITWGRPDILGSKLPK